MSVCVVGSVGAGKKRYKDKLEEINKLVEEGEHFKYVNF